MDDSLGFGLDYADELFYCEVQATEDSYELFFDSKPVASITLNIYFRWMLCSGAIIPQSIIDEIGIRIESYFE